MYSPNNLIAITLRLVMSSLYLTTLHYKKYRVILFERFKWLHTIGD